MGIWSCLGKNLDEVAQSLREGRSGIGIEEYRKEYGYRSALTGIVERPVLKGVIDRRLRVGMSEEAEYAYMASKEALAMANITDDYLQANEVGVIFGTDSSAKALANPRSSRVTRSHWGRSRDVMGSFRQISSMVRLSS